MLSAMCVTVGLAWSCQDMARGVDHFPQSLVVVVRWGNGGRLRGPPPPSLSSISASPTNARDFVPGSCS